MLFSQQPGGSEHSSQGCLGSAVSFVYRWWWYLFYDVVVSMICFLSNHRSLIINILTPFISIRFNLIFVKWPYQLFNWHGKENNFMHLRCVYDAFMKYLMLNEVLVHNIWSLFKWTTVEPFAERSIPVKHNATTCCLTRFWVHCVQSKVVLN